jgi:hypothetical protein
MMRTPLRIALVSVLPLFFGFLIGAVVGTIATAATAQELHEEAAAWFQNIHQWFANRKRGRKAVWLKNIQKWFEDRRRRRRDVWYKDLKKWFQRSADIGPPFNKSDRHCEKDAGKPPWWPIAALEMTKIQVLAIFAAIWTIGLLWVILLLPAWDTKSHVQYILGSLVGAAAAPWIWLHFSRRMERQSAITAEVRPGTDEVRGGAQGQPGDIGDVRPDNPDGTQSGDPDQVRSANINRVQSEKGDGEFRRYQFMTYMLGAALLIAILQPFLSTLAPRTNKIEGFGVALNFAPSRSDHASAVLQVGQSATGAAATIGRLSGATRKAHLVATGRQKGELTGKLKGLRDIPATMEGFGDLSLMDRDRVYIAYFYHEQNASADLHTFSNLQEYVDAAKNGVMIDQKDADFLAGLSNLTNCIGLYAEKLRDFRLFLVDSEPFLRSLVVNVSTNWIVKDNQTQAASPKNLSMKTAAILTSEIIDALKPYKASIDVCTEAAKSTKGADPDVSGIGKTTPYPAYLIAYYMAAIDSVESGVLILRDWLIYQKEQFENNGLPRSTEQDWYTIRAMLASSQLPGLGNAPSHRALVQFQQETTDRMGKMLGVNGAATWRSWCRRLHRKGLHAHVGRFLAMTYADERNFLFELLRPEDFGLLPRGDTTLQTTKISPATYLEEAEAFVEKPQCFAGVARFDRKLLGQYSLNIAQLRLARRASATGDERGALTKQIKADLEAAQQLGESKDVEILDLLREPDEFAPQRERLAPLKGMLDTDSDKD